MDDVTKTDKMLARKDGRVGYVIFNNPERHNAVSLMDQIPVVAAPS